MAFAALITPQGTVNSWAKYSPLTRQKKVVVEIVDASQADSGVAQ